jgi:hypothetical protein
MGGLKIEDPAVGLGWGLTRAKAGVSQGPGGHDHLDRWHGIGVGTTAAFPFLPLFFSSFFFLPLTFLPPCPTLPALSSI